MRKVLGAVSVFVLAAAIIAAAAFAMLYGVTCDKAAVALTIVLIVCLAWNRRENK